MPGLAELLRTNRNYRYTWTGQVVSEIGDHFNNIAVFSLALAVTKSGMVVAGILLARAIPLMFAGPLAGVLLDRMDRKRIMIASDLARAVIAAGFVLTVRWPYPWLLYVLSGMLGFASPFFTSGRSSILPAIASREELHTANSVTQTTQWCTLVFGTMSAGYSAALFGHQWAFGINSFSFLFSAWAISKLRAPKGTFRAERAALTEAEVARPWHEYVEGLRYMRHAPLILGIAVVNVGWATGGGAAQILFSLFGELVFKRGPAGIGEIWSCAGIGLVIGGMVAHWFGKRASFAAYKRSIVVAYIIHGGAYVLFSQARQYWLALVFIGLSRAAVAVSSVLNMSQLLRNVPDAYRGRVFATLESLQWSMMLVSMTAAGIASTHYSPRLIGLWSGILSSTTALAWGLLNWAGRLPEPAPEGVDPDEVEVHGEPRA
jgi:MFS family permease